MKRLAYGLLMTTMLLASSQILAVELITNHQLPQNTISRNVLRAIFSMRMTKWPDGKPIQVFVLDDKNPLHADFSKRFLGVFPHQLRRAWNRKIYAGTGQAPTKVASENEMRQQIINTPGAIGYISKEMISEQLQKITVK